MLAHMIRVAGSTMSNMIRYAWWPWWRITEPGPTRWLHMQWLCWQVTVRWGA
jgi:hypothetical protein